MSKYKCPECSDIEDEQYYCTTCEGKLTVTLEEAQASGFDVDDLIELKEWVKDV